MEASNPHEEDLRLGLGSSLSPQDDQVGAAYVLNLDAAAANPALNPGSTSGAYSAANVDPDDFYRNYQSGQPQSLNPSNPPTRLAAPSDADPVPSSHLSQRKAPTISSNGSATPSRPPPVGIPQGHRAGFRSASAPLAPNNDKNRNHTRPSAARAAAVNPGTSVKDLKKKFDQTSSLAPSHGRKPSSRISSRSTSPSGIPAPESSSTTRNTPTSSPFTAGRNSSARDPARGASSRGSQRQRHAAAKDHASNSSNPSNSQSFASRINKSRNNSSPAIRSPRSVAHLRPEPSPSSSSIPVPKQPPTSPPRSGPLLFGEILPGQELTVQSLGFGIENNRPRRTSDSSVHIHPRQHHQRTFSDPDVDVEPHSPSDWYRNHASRTPTRPSATSAPSAASAASAASASAAQGPKNHGRANSDLSSRASSARSNKHPESPGSSRIPLSMRKLASSSNSSSPPSSRAASPSKLTTPRPPKSGIAARAKTPTRLAPSSSASSSSRREAGTHHSSRLAISVSSPPPKTSPQLRSSRPRQPVSSATTASSRRKMVDRNAFKQQQQREQQQQQQQEGRRRNISIGPIDFEQRREHIRLAYTKSIRASRALEAQQVAAEIKRHEEEAAAAKARENGETSPEPQSEPVPQQEQLQNASSTRGQDSQAHHEEAVDVPLRITTTFVPPDPPQVSKGPTKTQGDSPTLPGSFPLGSPDLSGPVAGLAVEEEPMSAISNATAITEFDNETQTEAPREQYLSPLDSSYHALDPPPPPAPSAPRDAPPRVSVPSPALTPVPLAPAPPSLTIPSDHVTTPTTADRAEYRQPSCFDDEQLSPEERMIPIAIDMTTPTGPTPTAPLQVALPPAPVAPEPLPTEPSEPARAEDEYEPKPYTFQSDVYETTVTIVSRESTYVADTNEKEEVSRDMLADEDQNDYQIRLDSVDPRTLRHISHTGTPDAVNQEGQTLDGLERLEEFYVGPHIRDSVSLHRDSTFESNQVGNTVRSSVAHTEESSCTSLDSHRELDVSRSRSVNSLLTPANRVSQASAWTDFSIGSVDSPSEVSRKEPPPPLPVLERKMTSGSEVQRVQSSNLEEIPESQSAEISPREIPASSSAHDMKNHLPEVDTGAGFALPYLSQKNSIPQLPNQAPPPVPPLPSQTRYDAEQPAATPTEYFNDSQAQATPPAQAESSQYATRDDHSSFTMGPSRRESEDYYPVSSARHSIDQVSFDSIDGQFTPGSGPGISSLDISRPDDGSTLVEYSTRQSEASFPDKDKQALSGKEKSRLLQRQMVIRELVDTEAVFIRDMNIVEEIYKGTAEACPKLDGKTVKLVFRNTDEIINFHATFMTELRDAVSPVYSPKGRRSPQLKEDSTTTLDGLGGGASTPASTAPSSASVELDDGKDRLTTLGPAFMKNIELMKIAHEGFLRSSDHAAKRLIEIQEDPTVKVWLTECNEVAKDLTQAWNLDSLLIKPMQRITKYPNLIAQLLQYTPHGHPDREPLVAARTKLEEAILEINKTKKNFELVGQIVGRKRKESDVRAGIARVLGKRVDKLQASNNRPPEDPEYAKLHERFGDDYLRLQVVLRDVEFYTRQVSAYVHEFLQYLSSMELVMRLQPSPFPELESKWVRFNVSMRDVEKVALEQHLSQVRKHVIEPFEQVIKSYGNPSLAMKKRAKRRLDYERSVQSRKSGKKIDKALAEQVEQYDALNETLKKELPRLSSLTEKVGNICLGNFVNIQSRWYSIWKDKVKVVLEDAQVPETSEIVASFNRNFQFAEEQFNDIKMLATNASAAAATASSSSMSIRTSQATSQTTGDDMLLSRSRSQPGNSLASPRGRGLSVNSEAMVPALPTNDFSRRHSGQLTLSPTATQAPSIPSPGFYYRDYYSGLNSSGSGNAQGRGSGSPITPGEMPNSARSYAPGLPPPPPPVTNSTGMQGRPSTGGSYASGPVAQVQRAGVVPESPGATRRDSNSTYSSNYYAQENRRFSGVFHSALPLPDGPEDSGQGRERDREEARGRQGSRASSQERNAGGWARGGGEREMGGGGGYNIMWLAASLFEFNIETTKHEAGYPYLTYQAGEIFDVIAEKGELWLAKNQDDPSELVGWIWSKHFAKLADQ